jgi:plastocyanin domain-containing protein
MNAADLLVILAGLITIAWVNWYFFLAGRGSVAASASAEGVQEVAVVVHGGYSPANLRLKRGVPARLVFDRQETSGCSEEVVLPDFNIRRFLPPFQKTTVEITPEKAGQFGFTCGMGMLRGQITVEE